MKGNIDLTGLIKLYSHTRKGRFSCGLVSTQAFYGQLGFTFFRTEVAALIWKDAV